MSGTQTLPLVCFILLTFGLVGTQIVPPAALNCDPDIQLDALLDIYTSTNGTGWTYNNISNTSTQPWNSTAACFQDSVVNFTSPPVQLPAHCCWQGVYCCIDPVPCPPNVTNAKRYHCNCTRPGAVTALRLMRSNMVGFLTDVALGNLSCNLQGVDLSFNKLSGTLPPVVASFTGLKVLALGYNNLTGPLPLEGKSMPRLQVLELTNNSLSGTIPPDICTGTALTDLLLSHNNFTGELHLAPCPRLVLLDVSSNNLSGTLPDFTGFDMLHILRMQNNSFVGGVPSTLTLAPWLSSVNLANNNLDGSLPEEFAALRLMSRVTLTNNSLVGTLPKGLFSNMGSLTFISFLSNNITGTISIPENSMPVPTLTYIDFFNSSIVGKVPDFMSVYANGTTYVTLELTFMSCCGLQPLGYDELQYKNYTWQAYRDVNWSAVLDPGSWLPPFLDFSDTLLPVMPRIPGVIDYQHMRCPALKRKGAPNNKLLQWTLDPDYYLFENCECELGFEKVNKTQPGRLPWFMCEPKKQPFIQRYPWAIPVIVMGGILMVLLFMCLTCCRVGARPAVLQQYHNILKRLEGEPREGLISVVTTDIEGYSDLMKREPDLMGKGLRIHNFCIDAARWQFYGYTMEQEGDSFTIAFHEPFDAVAFCLMAQQLLNLVEWPTPLQNPEGLVEPRNRPGSVFSNAFLSAARLILEKDSSVPRSGIWRPGMGSGTQGNPSNPTSPSPTGLGSPSPLTLADVGSLEALAPKLDPDHGSAAGEQGSVQSTSQGTSELSAAAPSSSESSRQRMLKLSRLWRDGNRKTEPPILEDQAAAMPAMSTLQAATNSIGGSPDSPGGLQGGGIQLSALQQQDGRTSLFCGLRVRMGCATGMVQKGTPLRASTIMERAKIVSDAGAGGQVLMDDATYNEIKGRLLELGAVNHNGLSVAKANLSRPTLLEACCAKCSTPRDLSADMAVVLDMGQYMRRRPTGRPAMWPPGFNRPASAVRLHDPTSTRHRSSPLQRRTADDTAGDQQQPAASAVAASAAQQQQPQVAAAAAAAEAAAAIAAAAATDVGSNRLHLHQILSPTLIGRAKYFGTKLALGTDFLCVEPPTLIPEGQGATAVAAALGALLDGRAEPTQSTQSAPT